MLSMDAVREKLVTFYNTLKDSQIFANSPNNCILYNIDEASIDFRGCFRSLIPSSSHYISPILISMIVCISSEGTLLPLCLIKKGGLLNHVVLDYDSIKHIFCKCKYCPRDILYFVNSSGSAHGPEFKAYLDSLKGHFMEEYRSTSKRIGLIMDNHSIHTQTFNVGYMNDYPDYFKVIVLPVGSTYFLQPLDNGFFYHFKKEVKALLANGYDKKLIGLYLHHALNNISSLIPNLIKSGFKNTGIVPYDFEMPLNLMRDGKASGSKRKRAHGIRKSKAKKIVKTPTIPIPPPQQFNIPDVGHISTEENFGEHESDISSISNTSSASVQSSSTVWQSKVMAGHCLVERVMPDVDDLPDDVSENPTYRYIYVIHNEKVAEQFKVLILHRGDILCDYFINTSDTQHNVCYDSIKAVIYGATEVKRIAGRIHIRISKAAEE